MNGFASLSDSRPALTSDPSSTDRAVLAGAIEHCIGDFVAIEIDLEFVVPVEHVRHGVGQCQFDCASSTPIVLEYFTLCATLTFAATAPPEAAMVPTGMESTTNPVRNRL